MTKTKKDLLERIIEACVNGVIDTEEMYRMADAVERKKEVAIYTRIGYSAEAELRRAALDAQRSKLEKFAKEQGHIVVAHYEDDGYSANDLERPGLVQLKQDYAAGKYDSVLVTNYDRLLRRNMLHEPEWSFEIEVPWVTKCVSYMRVGNKNQLR